MLYFPQIKTTSAELEAFNHLIASGKDVVLPIIQLTKPRLARKLTSVEYLEKHIANIMKTLGEDRPIIVDITDDETFQDANLSAYVHDSSEGYKHWVERVISIKQQYNDQIIPSVVGKASTTTVADIKLQIRKLLHVFPYISLRFPVRPGDNVQQLQQIFEILGLADVTDRLYLLFDFGYVSAWADVEATLEELNAFLIGSGWRSNNITLLSSCPASFPIKERKSAYIDRIKIVEFDYLRWIKEHSVFSYGDYCYIHPRRNEGAGFWLPRVDYPAADGYCHYTRSFNRKLDRSQGRLKIENLYSNEQAFRELAAAISSEEFLRAIQSSAGGETELSTTHPREKKYRGKVLFITLQ